MHCERLLLLLEVGLFAGCRTILACLPLLVPCIVVDVFQLTRSCVIVRAGNHFTQSLWQPREESLSAQQPSQHGSSRAPSLAGPLTRTTMDSLLAKSRPDFRRSSKPNTSMVWRLLLLQQQKTGTIFSDLNAVITRALHLMSSSSSTLRQWIQAWLCRAPGIYGTLHHLQLTPADTGMAAKRFRQLQRLRASDCSCSYRGRHLLQRFASSRLTRSCSELLTAASEGVIIFSYPQWTRAWPLRDSGSCRGSELLTAATEVVISFNDSQAADSRVATQSFWQQLQRTSSPSRMQAQTLRASGSSCRGLHHLQLTPADTVMGMAAQSFWQLLQRTSSPSTIHMQAQPHRASDCSCRGRHLLQRFASSRLTRSCSELLATAAEGAIPFNDSHAGSAAHSF